MTDEFIAAGDDPKRELTYRVYRCRLTVDRRNSAVSLTANGQLSTVNASFDSFTDACSLGPASAYGSVSPALTAARIIPTPAELAALDGAAPMGAAVGDRYSAGMMEQVGL